MACRLQDYFQYFLILFPVSSPTFYARNWLFFFFSVKEQIVNVLGFVSQEAKSRILWKYLHYKRENKLYFSWQNLKYTKNREKKIEWASLVAQRLKHLPVMWETWVRSLGWEDPLEKEMATHSSILAWRIPWTEEPGGLQSMGSQRVRHD